MRLILHPARQVVNEDEAKCVVMYVSVQASAKTEAGWERGTVNSRRVNSQGCP